MKQTTIGPGTTSPVWAVSGTPPAAPCTDFVTRQAEPAGRDEAAATAGVGRTLAAYHLDRMVEDGLLEVSFARRTGRSGPGAGRPAKLYRRSPRHVHVSLPERRYELAGRLLAEAVQTATSKDVAVEDAVAASSSALGDSLGSAVLRRAGGGADRERLRTALVEVLEEHGYEPRYDADLVTLRNCPFDLLAKDYPQLVCGMNLRVLTALTSALPAAGIRATLAPAEGRCCVTLHIDP